MSPNEIEAAYAQFKNTGLLHVNRLSGAPLTIDEWRGRELRRWASEQMKQNKQ
jgi:hypothetical protein